MQLSPELPDLIRAIEGHLEEGIIEIKGLWAKGTQIFYLVSEKWLGLANVIQTWQLWTHHWQHTKLARRVTIGTDL
jgi:hypothetical protein